MERQTINNSGPTQYPKYDPQFMFKCSCGLCLFLRTYNGTQGGWADPRRGYMESEGDFLKRVPNGFLVWPTDHRF